jgi:AcrR family transcriptional regulator
MELFALHGPAAVSVRQIAGRAGVNHALVFRHFGSKEGLVRAVWERAAEELAGHVVGVPDYQGFTALSEALAESETIWRLIARAILDGEIEAFAAHSYRFVDAMVWATARGQEAGMVEARIHPRLIVAMVCAMGLGWLVFHPVLMPLLGLPPREPEEQRYALRTAVVRLLGWHGAPPLGRSSH